MQLSVSVPPKGLGRAAPKTAATGRRTETVRVSATPCAPAEGGFSRERETDLPALQGGRALRAEAHPETAEGVPQEGATGPHPAW